MKFDDGGDQRRQAERTAQRAVGDPLDRPVPQARHQHRRNQHHQQRQRHGNACEERCENEEDDQGREGAEHENVTMGKIDHADDAVDHRVADCDKAVDGSKSQPVGELLDEVLHIISPGCDPIGRISFILDPCGSPDFRRIHYRFWHKCEDKKPGARRKAIGFQQSAHRRSRNAKKYARPCRNPRLCGLPTHRSAAPGLRPHRDGRRKSDVRRLQLRPSHAPEPHSHINRNNSLPRFRFTSRKSAPTLWQTGERSWPTPPRS